MANSIVGPTGPMGPMGPTGPTWRPNAKELSQLVCLCFKSLGFQPGDRVVVQAPDGRTKYIQLVMLDESYCEGVHDE